MAGARYKGQREAPKVGSSGYLIIVSTTLSRPCANMLLINAQCAPMKGEGPNSAAGQVSLRRGRRSFPVLHCLPGRQERLIRTEL